MRSDGPRTPLWGVAIAIGVLGIIGNFIAIPVVSGYAFWFVVMAFVLLVISSS